MNGISVTCSFEKVTKVPFIDGQELVHFNKLRTCSFEQVARIPFIGEQGKKSRFFRVFLYIYYL